MNEQRPENSPEQDPQPKPEQPPDSGAEQTPQDRPAQQREAAQPPDASEQAQTTPQEPSTETPQEKAEGRVGRIIMWAILVVFVILAFLDYRAKTAAEKTSLAWKEALRAKPVGTDLKQSQLPQYMRGEPIKETIEDPPKRPNVPAKTVDLYTWKGIFREYKVAVFLGLGSDPPVELIEGPAPEPDLGAENGNE